MTGRRLSWQRIDTGLVLVNGRIVSRVPAPIDQWLLAALEQGLSLDPADDLLRLESQLRADSRRTAGAAAKRETINGDAAGAALVRRRWWHVRGRRDGQHTAPQTATLTAQDEVQARVATLRMFIAALDATNLVLRRAVDGWHRGVKPPDTVSVYSDENAYLFAEPRRATIGPRGTQVIDGIEVWGQQWRRDPDDNPAVDYVDSGTWILGFIPALGEIYAVRRGTRPQVWRLGGGYGIGQATVLLTRLGSRMREPNSVVLAAMVVAHTTPRTPVAEQACSTSVHIGHTMDSGAPGNRYARQNLRRAVEAIARHLHQHPSLDAHELAVLNVATAPAPRLTADAHMLRWCAFDVRVRCGSPRDVLAWAHSTETYSTLTVHAPSTDAAQLRLETRMLGGAVIVTAQAGELAKLLGIPANTKKSLTITQLSRMLEASAAATSTSTRHDASVPQQQTSAVAPNPGRASARAGGQSA